MAAWICAWHDILDGSGINDIVDPLERLERLFEVMADAYLHSPVGYGCLVGTVVQERATSSESLTASALEQWESWARRTTNLLIAAKSSHPPKVDFEPEEVAWWLQSFVQGTLLIAKAKPDRDFVLANIRHCRAYVMGLFE